MFNIHYFITFFIFEVIYCLSFSSAIPHIVQVSCCSLLFLPPRCQEMWGRVSSIDPLIYLCINTLPHPHLQHEWGYASCSHHHSCWDCKPHRLWVKQRCVSETLWIFLLLTSVKMPSWNILFKQMWICCGRGAFLALCLVPSDCVWFCLFFFLFGLFNLSLFHRPFLLVTVLNQLPLPSPLPATTTKSLLYNGRIAEEVTCLLGCRDENLASQLAHGLNQVSTEHM